ncbi:MAG: dephospho-CoA kinase [Proteocatella sp.]
MKKIGITGNIGSGKSQVTSYLLSKGYKVLDADKLVAEIYSDRNFVSEMIGAFGNQIVGENRLENNQELVLDKKAIAMLVFKEDKLLDKLNKLISPYINQKMKLQITEYEKTEEILFLDIPLLYEKNMEKDLDKVILVYCDDSIRFKRASHRDGKTVEEIMTVDSFQMPQDKKLDLADYVIRNNASIEELKLEIDTVLEIINMIKDKR